MKPEQIDDLLKRTLSDSRVSRGEKKILTAMVKEQQGDAQKLGFLQHRAFELARQELISPDAIQVLEWLEDVIKILLPSPPPRSEMRAFFSPGETCRAAIVGAIEGARRKIDICVFTITDNNISNAIIEAHRRGLMLRVITDNDKSEDRGSDIDRFRREGINVLVDETDKHMHHKFAIFDGEYVLTGSYNWTRSAADYNQENVVITDDEEIISAFEEEFERLFVQFY